MRRRSWRTACGRMSSRSSTARPGRYRKKVVLEDGTVVKNYDGPLDGGAIQRSVATSLASYTAFVATLAAR
jgi:hypothetical protein